MRNTIAGQSMLDVAAETLGDLVELACEVTHSPSRINLLSRTMGAVGGIAALGSEIINGSPNTVTLVGVIVLGASALAEL